MYSPNRAYETGRSTCHPIHKLPDELLAQIFRCAGASRPRDLHLINESDTIPLLRYPDYIAQTCARWRQVALTCSSLWTRIHLTPHPTHFNLILDRAKLYQSQSGWPGTVHRLHLFSYKILGNSPRGGFTSDFERESLAGILRGCSKVFTTLVVSSEGLRRPGFIKPLDDKNRGRDDMRLQLSLEQIERGLAHLTVLHASHICPTWGSTAYQGLVDLRLMPNHQYTFQCPVICAPEFIAILQASPRLRILHFGLDLSFSSHGPSTDKTSAQLNDLEVLYLSASRAYGDSETTEYEIQYIMRHITPGKQPLRLTLDHVRYHQRTPLKGIKAFFGRSRIVKFCARRGTPPPVELLNHAPHLTHLVFDGCLHDRLYNLIQDPCEIKLESWVIRGSSICITDVGPLLECCIAESCVISNSRFSREDNDYLEISASELEDWNRQLPDCVRYVWPDPFDPTASWNDLD